MAVAEWRQQPLKVILTFTAALVGGIVLLSSSEVMLARLGSSFEYGESGGRFDIWSGAADLFASNPVLGHGRVNSLLVLGTMIQGEGLYAVHNSYLGALTRGGLLGGFAFLAAFGLCCRDAWRSRGLEGGGFVLAATCVASVACLTIDYDTGKLFWLVLSCVVGASLSRVSAESAKQERISDEPKRARSGTLRAFAG